MILFSRLLSTMPKHKTARLDVGRVEEDQKDAKKEKPCGIRLAKCNAKAE